MFELIGRGRVMNATTILLGNLKTIKVVLLRMELDEDNLHYLTESMARHIGLHRLPKRIFLLVICFTG